MKEFALRHPWLTFFLADAAISGVVKITAMVINAVTGRDCSGDSLIKLAIKPHNNEEEDDASNAD